ncbi:MAG: hypothetical protein SGBAC_006179 [Bacillariaceae sp.]
MFGSTSLLARSLCNRAVQPQNSNKLVVLPVAVGPAGVVPRRKNTPSGFSSSSTSNLVDCVTKNEIIDKVCETHDLSLVQTKRILNTVLDTILDCVRDGKRVVISKFGTFEARSFLDPERKSIEMKRIHFKPKGPLKPKHISRSRGLRQSQLHTDEFS